MITITVAGVKNVIADIEKIAPATQEYVIAKMSEIAYDSMKMGAAKHRKTGALEASINNRRAPGGRVVGHDVDYLTRAGGVNYAPFVLYGTRRHEIKPKTKKALRWPKGGGFQFAKFVNHPGYIGDDYLSRAALEAVSKFQSIVNEAMKKGL